MKIRIWYALTLGAGVFVGCGEQTVDIREYQEITIAPQAPPSAPMSSPALMDAVPADTAMDFHWHAPEGWEEQPAGGMRLATFLIGDAPLQGECSLVLLSGRAGSLRANVERWLGQLELTLSDTEVSDFLEQAPEMDVSWDATGTFLDFTALHKAQHSMLAAVLPYKDSTLFVKLTGPVSLLQKEKQRMLEFCRTIHAESH